MSRSTKLTRKQWNLLSDKLKQDYPLSTFLLRNRMKETLGFVNRDHRYYDPVKHQYHEYVYLDWYSEPKRTLFLLKYSELLEQ